MTILDYLSSRNIKVDSVSGDEAHIHCPFHEDEKSSLSINVRTGLWKCFGGCDAGGNFAQFHSKMYGTPYAEAEKDIAEMGVVLEAGKPLEKQEVKFISEVEIKRAHERLLASPDTLAYLIDKRKWSLEIIHKFLIGFDGMRIWIPIKNQLGNYINVRKYDYLHKSDAKMTSYGPGYGSIVIFPVENLQKDEVVLFEGEPDCLAALSMGINAITLTGGAGSWKEEFSEALKGKKVKICYDADEAGRQGAEKIVRVLSGAAVSAHSISLPIDPPLKDFTDYILNGGTTEIFEKWDIPVQEPVEVPETITTSEALNASLQETSHNKYYYIKVRSNVIVSGKDLAPYFIPKVVELRGGCGLRKCPGCPATKPEGARIETFADHDQSLLAMVDMPEKQFKEFFREIFNINCKTFEYVIKEVYNIESIRVIPEVDYSVSSSEYVTRQVFSISNGLRTNKSYEIEAMVLPNPKNQYATLLIDKITPKQSSIDDFKLSPEQIEELKVFQDDGDIGKKLEEIYTDFEQNVTKIYNRKDLMLAMDLVFHSVLNYSFMGKQLKKGWTECLIIGDTRCGKSETASELIKHYRAGELCTGENTSYAGLIGGMQQTQKTWSISWGKIPLNDGRIVILDEASGLTQEQIANMSGVRSSGIAEVVKIQTERTNARTRLVWLSNSRSGRKLDTYSQGVLAIRELIGKLEDIARFDFALTCASGEVNVDEIYKIRDEKVEHRYTSDLCHNLVLWSWSRKENNVHFSSSAIKRILDGSMQLGRRYSSTIPLVEVAEQRIKVARLSVALAARLFSTDDGENINVEEKHVEYVLQFLEHCYKKPSMGYDVYSEQIKATEVLDETQFKNLEAEFYRFPVWRNLRDALLDNQFFNKQQLTEQIGYDFEDGRALFKFLGRNKFIRSTAKGYVKSPAFTDFLKRLVPDRPKEFNNPKDTEF